MDSFGRLAFLQRLGWLRVRLCFASGYAAHLDNPVPQYPVVLSGVMIGMQCVRFCEVVWQLTLIQENINKQSIYFLMLPTLTFHAHAPSTLESCAPDTLYMHLLRPILPGDSLDPMFESFSHSPDPPLIPTPSPQHHFGTAAAVRIKPCWKGLRLGQEA